jgi:hypothetical protein
MNVATATGVLGYNVNALQFNYFEKDAVVKWKNTWDSTVKKFLPDAIEVKMITSDIRNRHTETSTNIISIP